MVKKAAVKLLLDTGLGSLGKKVSPFVYRQELIKNNLVSLRKANPEMTFSDMAVIINKDFATKNLKPISTHTAQQHARNLKLAPIQEKGTFVHKGETCPESKGVKTYDKDPTRASGVHPRWVPKAIRGKKERPHLKQNPVYLKQLEEIEENKKAMGEMDQKWLKNYTSIQLAE
jgi:hypothetical protein